MTDGFQSLDEADATESLVEAIRDIEQVCQGSADDDVRNRVQEALGNRNGNLSIFVRAVASDSLSKLRGVGGDDLMVRILENLDDKDAAAIKHAVEQDEGGELATMIEDFRVRGSKIDLVSLKHNLRESPAGA